MAIYFMPKNTKKFAAGAREDLTSVDEVKDVAGKMNKLVSLLEIPTAEYETRRGNCAELRELLRKYYPDCMLLTFGSTVNGFGLKYSDLDLLFLPFPGYCNTNYATKDKEIMEIPVAASIESGEISKDVLTKLDEFSHLKFIRSILKKEKKLVQRHYLIPSKNSPTLRIHLAATKLVCDLCASNRLVVYNSELLQLFVKIDPRVKPLVITLRFWAQSLGLLKRNYFSSYGFTLMVIFFLQNTNPPILPPVKRLIDMSGFNRQIAGWQTAFTDVPLPKTKNTETLEELLLHFFQFYWNFDFTQNIISPHNGKALPIRDLKKSQDKRLEEFKVVSINIQDPFVLSRNCCLKDGPHSVLNLAFFTAYQMLQDKSGKFKFSMLFDSSVYDKIFHLHFGKYAVGKERVFFINLDYDCRTSISKAKKGSPTWFDRAAQAVYDVLQYGLLMDCDVTDQMPWGSQNSKNDMESNGAPIINLIETSKAKNSPFDLQLLISMQCIVYTRVWIGRKQLAEQLAETKKVNQDDFEEFSHPVLKAEHDLSKALIKSNPLIDSPQPILCFKCECYKHNSPQIPDIVVILKPLTASKEFHTVSTFIQSYINKTVKKIIASD